MFTQSTRPTRWSVKAFSLLMVATMLLAALPQSAMAAKSNPNCDYYYTVLKNQTIQKVARATGKSVNSIANANNLSAPYTLAEGDKLCIPKSAKDRQASSSGKKYTFSPSIYNGTLSIAGSGFSPNKDAFFVRVRDRRGSIGYKLGNVGVRSDGTIKGNFDLPSSLEDSPFVVACIKNTYNDALLCKTIANR